LVPLATLKFAGTAEGLVHFLKGASGWRNSLRS